MSLRLQRVRELLKREIGEVIRRQLPVDVDVRRAARAVHRDLCGPRQLRRRGFPLRNS